MRQYDWPGVCDAGVELDPGLQRWSRQPLLSPGWFGLRAEQTIAMAASLVSGPEPVFTLFCLLLFALASFCLLLFAFFLFAFVCVSFLFVCFLFFVRFPMLAKPVVCLNQWSTLRGLLNQSDDFRCLLTHSDDSVLAKSSHQLLLCLSDDLASYGFNIAETSAARAAARTMRLLNGSGRCLNDSGRCFFASRCLLNGRRMISSLLSINQSDDIIVAC